MTNYIYGLKLLPDYMHDGILLYIQSGVIPGGFLQFCLEWRWEEAARVADGTNKHLLPTYKKYLRECAPFNCYGSPEKVKAWHEAKGLSGNGASARLKLIPGGKSCQT